MRHMYEQQDDMYESLDDIADAFVKDKNKKKLITRIRDLAEAEGGDLDISYDSIEKLQNALNNVNMYLLRGVSNLDDLQDIVYDIDEYIEDLDYLEDVDSEDRPDYIADLNVIEVADNLSISDNLYEVRSRFWDEQERKEDDEERIKDLYNQIYKKFKKQLEKFADSLLDSGIEHTLDTGDGGTDSFYLTIVNEDEDMLKIRFSNHEELSRRHPTPDYNFSYLSIDKPAEREIKQFIKYNDEDIFSKRASRGGKAMELEDFPGFDEVEDRILDFLDE